MAGNDQSAGHGQHQPEPEEEADEHILRRHGEPGWRVAEPCSRKRCGRARQGSDVVGERQRKGGDDTDDERHRAERAIDGANAHIARKEKKTIAARRKAGSPATMVRVTMGRRSRTSR